MEWDPTPTGLPSLGARAGRGSKKSISKKKSLVSIDQK